MSAEAVDGDIFDMIEDQGGAQIRLAELEANILQGDGASVAGVEAVGRHGTEHEVLAGNLRKIASRGVLCCAAAAEGEVDVVEGDIFEDRSSDGAERDAGVALSEVVVAGDGGVAELWRVGGDGAVDVAEGDVADDCRIGWVRRFGLRRRAGRGGWIAARRWARC